MPLTAAQLVAQAAADAHVPNYLATAQNKIQIVLDDLCLKHDFALARGVYYFPLNPTLVTNIGGNPNFSGPYPLPLDYLRTSGSSGSEGVQYSLFYYFDGVPYPLQPWDLGRMDVQVQQPGIQNFPYAYATDISPETTAQDRLAGITTASTSITSNVITVAAQNNMAVGMGLAGNGIAAGAMITAITGSSISMSISATATFVNVTGAGAAAVMFGTPPNLFVYPGPSGAFPTTLRYQRLMPPLLDFTRVPWFPDQQYLLTRLTGEMADTSDDTRAGNLKQQAMALLGQYETFSDDKTNRAQRANLDRQRFGRAFSRLPNTKTTGW